MSSNTNVLITGSSRGTRIFYIPHRYFTNTQTTGIGKGLVAAYLNLPATTVVAAVRKASSAESLHSLPKASGSRLLVIEIDVASVDTIKRGIASLKTDHNIDSLDIVLANAGHVTLSPNVAESEIVDIQLFVDVNVYGQLELYKAVAPLLRRSQKELKPKFMYMSSMAGSLTSMNIIADMSAYGASKAFANFLFRWLSFEQRDIVIWAQHPG